MSGIERIRARSSSTAFHLRARGLTGPVVLAIVALVTGTGAVVARLPVGGTPSASAAAAPVPPDVPSAPPIDVPFLATGVEGIPPTLPCDQPVVLRYDGDGAPYEARGLVAEAATWLAAAAQRPIVFETGAISSDLAPTPGRVELRVTWVSEIDGSDAILGRGGPFISGGEILAGQVALAASTAWPTTDLAGGELGVLLHEAGHALFNLAHSPDPSRQMFATAQRDRAPGFSAEELDAIAWVANSSCPPGRARA